MWRSVYIAWADAALLKALRCCLTHIPSFVIFSSSPRFWCQTFQSDGTAAGPQPPFPSCSLSVHILILLLCIASGSEPTQLFSSLLTRRLLNLPWWLPLLFLSPQDETFRNNKKSTDNSACRETYVQITRFTPADKIYSCIYSYWFNAFQDIYLKQRGQEVCLP